MSIDWQAVAIIFNSVAIIGTIIGVVSNWIISWKKAPYEIKETENKAAGAIAKAASDVVTSASTQLEHLSTRIECLEAENREMKSVILKLETENRDMERRVIELEERITGLEKERDTIKGEKDNVVIGARELVKQLKSISPDTKPVYVPPDK